MIRWFSLLLLSYPSALCKIEVTNWADVSNNCLKDVLGTHWEGTESLLIAENPHFMYSPKSVTVISNGLHLENFLAKSPQKPDLYFISYKSLESLEEILNIIANSPMFAVSRYIIFLSNNENDPQDVAKILWNFKLPNSLIIQPTPDTHLNIYQVQVMDCGALSRANLILTLFPDGCTRELKELPHFGFKASFLGCELRVLWSRYPPFTYPLTNPHGWRGILFDFLKPLKHLSGRNITFSGDDSEYFSQIADMYSYEEILQDLENETLLYAGAAHLSTSEIFDISAVLFDDKLTILVPRTLATQWSALASAISVQNFLFGLSIFVIVAMLVFYINNRTNRTFAASLTKVMMMEFRVLVGGGGGFSLTSTDSLLRLFTGTILLQYMVFSFFFQAATISSLTSGPMYEPPIKDIEQFLKSGHVMKMTRMHEMHLQYAKTFDSVSALLVQHSVVVDDYDMVNVLDEMIRERKSATFGLSGLLLMRPNAEKTFTTFEYLTIHFGVAMKKNQYSSPQLQSWIFQLVETGFLSRFINLHHNELVLKYSVDMEKRKTNMDLTQFLLVMRILVYGCLISIASLICELVWYNLVKRNINLTRKLGQICNSFRLH